MKSEYKSTMVVTSLIILFPILIGLILWGELPDQIATHFGANNAPDGWSSKAMTVLGLPFLMLFIQWVVFLLTSYDPKKKNINDKIFKTVLWIIPLVSSVVFLATYMTALGYNLNVGLLVNLLVGLVFIVLGNYLHKVKQNYTVGIKLAWTLNSKENWNRTNRMGGWIYILGGLLFIFNAVFQQIWLLIAIIAMVIILPVLYSFALFKKES
ncbi:hemolysin expression modulating protein [Tetragenococcus halophilus subsp. flandriensis]|uniref:SdpI family protein n=1 Tax=Tetragenococcus halophilus TaxID=51669 RepID=UPI0023E98F46|nr:SdpI family protein [Tetragenococcus halophilus]GMA08474.1 hemolysin expression modulating protein [Tetragenococcus halophilus subsp. flandriensis]